MLGVRNASVQDPIYITPIPVFFSFLPAHSQPMMVDYVPSSLSYLDCW